MAKPTRKQPDRRKSTAGPAKGSSSGATRNGAASVKRRAGAKPRRNIVVRAASGMLRLALRNPAIFGGTAAFAVVFGFVAANALWYQPGHHPSPLLRTRLPFTHPDPSRVSLNDPQTVPDPSKVTTFVIRREDEASEPDPGDTTTEALPTAERTASVPSDEVAALLSATPPMESAPDPDMDPATLARAVQAELARHGFYDGIADGRLGPKTTTAIRSFEQASGRRLTGIVSPDLLLALKDSGRGKSAGEGKAKAQATAMPLPRPTAIPTGKEAIDPIAAAIRAAEGSATLAQPATARPPAKPTETASAETVKSTGGASTGTGTGMVMSIQRGLTNLAYTDVSIDGVAGDQTRAAIRHFEKHYRLPETGEPSVAVLKKMKEIGAI